MRQTALRAAVRTVLTVLVDVGRFGLLTVHSRAHLSVRAPQPNAFCERLIGTIRRECLDFVIVLNERHLRRILQRWVAHYNRGRPHAGLGPGLPDPPFDQVVASNGHNLPEGDRVVATPILGDLHHEYRLEPKAA